MTNENGDDGVEAGIREWRRTKAEAEAAIEKCRVAEQDATFVRGQMEVLAAQKKADEERIRALAAHVAEMELYTNALAEAVISVVERRKAGMFRRAADLGDAGDRVREATNGGAGKVEAKPPEVERTNGDDPVDDGEPIPQFLGPARVTPADQLERDIAKLHERRRGKRE